MVGIASEASLGPSLERELLRQLHFMSARSYGGRGFSAEAQAVIYEWIGRDYADPGRELISRLAEQARTAGWYEVTEVRRGNRIGRFFSGPRVIYVPNPARADALETAVQTFVREWRRFLRDEPHVSSSLLAAAAAAISQRTAYQWDSPGG
jgi:hypothetical protein